ncbi:MAG: hypothetical protein V1644_02885 [Candidatus Micrarchaeota archaeon]
MKLFKIILILVVIAMAWCPWISDYTAEAIYFDETYRFGPVVPENLHDMPPAEVTWIPFGRIIQRKTTEPLLIAYETCFIPFWGGKICNDISRY